MATRSSSFTPSQRLDEVDPVLREPGHQTADIRLTPTGTDVSAGEGRYYNLGQASKRSVGMYELAWQPAASATADPLGAPFYVILEIYENTAGVFLARIRTAIEGGTATDDADDTSTNAAVALFTVDSGLDTDSDIEFFVAVAASVTANGVNGAPSGPIVVNDVILHDVSAASTRVYTIKRMVA